MYTTANKRAQDLSITTWPFITQQQKDTILAESEMIDNPGAPPRSRCGASMGR